MITFINDNLRCDLCEEGTMFFDPSSTMESYFVPETFVMSEIDEVIDKTINEYLVFRCRKCRTLVKYTFKDIEKKVRDVLYKNLISMVSMQELKNSNLGLVKKVLVYCGKCQGFDGKGSCPIKIYEGCKLKRLPIEL